MKIDWIKLKKPFVRWVPGLRWRPNIHEVELEITTFCNLRCYNCDRSARQAPSDECMSLGQIEKFVMESVELGWVWNQITLLGGEPTLHPQLTQILLILKRYKDLHPDCKVEIATNGCGARVKDVISRLPDWVSVRSTNKTSISHSFCSYNIAPVDSKECSKADFTKGCWITSACGLGLTRYGYYSCGAGASVDRVYGFDIGIKSLGEVTNEILKKQMRVLCGYCGHFKKNYSNERIREEAISESWKKAYADYQLNRPSLTEY